MNSFDILFMEADNAVSKYYDALTLSFLESGGYFEEAASSNVEKKKEGILQKVKRIIDTAIQKIKEFFTGKQHKKNQEVFEKACKVNPSLKNKKVKAIDYKKLDEEDAKALKALKKAKTPEEIERIKKRHEKIRKGIKAGVMMSATAALGSILYIKNKPATLKLSQDQYDQLFLYALDNNLIDASKKSIRTDRKSIYRFEENRKNKKAATKIMNTEGVRDSFKAANEKFKNVSNNASKITEDNQKMLDANKIKFKLGSDLTTARARSVEATNILNQNIRDIDYCLNQERNIVKSLIGVTNGLNKAEKSAKKVIRAAYNDHNETNKAIAEKWAKENKNNERKEKVKKAFTVDAGSVKD